jgi:putative ABC transport system permease protein
MRDLIQDLHHGLRGLRQAPGFTATVLLTLALGIGACAAIFTVVDAVLLRPLPFAEPERLVMLNESKPPEVPSFVVRPATFPHWKRQATSFEGLAVVRDGSYNLTGQGEPARVYAGKVTANAFPTLRVQPVLGRGFLPEEEVPGKDDVVILGHGFWQRQLGGRADVLFQTLRLDGRSHRVVGVMPAGFELPGRYDVYVPHGYEVFRRDESDNRTIEVFARLKGGVTIEQARNELVVIGARMAREDPGFYPEGWRPLVTPLLEARVAPARRPLQALLGAVGLLLLIACANVANLLLARGTVRAREIAVRAALGASRARLVRQLLTESLVLSVAAAGLGVLLARWGVSALLALAPEGMPRLQEIGVDGRVVGFSVALAILTGLVFGLAPALAATRPDLHGTLKESGRTIGQGRHRLRSALVVTEVAVAVVLLAGTGLLVHSFDRLRHVDRGFQPRGALAVNLTLPQEKYEPERALPTFESQALERLAALPGVTAVGAVQDLPFAGGLNLFCLKIEGRPASDQCEITRFYSITPDYFRAMGIAVQRGRVYDAADWKTELHTAVINQALARRYFPGGDALGKRIASANRPDELFTIVGIVADVRDDELAGAVGPQVYGVLSHQPAHTLTFVVRGAGVGLPAAIRSAMRSVDPEQPVASIRPLADLVAGSIARERFAATLFAVFAAVALLLAAAGVHAVMAYAVAERRSEIGIRLALGAQSGDVVRLVVGQGGRLAGAGLVLGLAGALLVGRLFEAMLFGIGPRDPLSFVVTAVVLVVAAAMACLVPAWRAARVNPLEALRAE